MSRSGNVLTVLAVCTMLGGCNGLGGELTASAPSGVEAEVARTGNVAAEEALTGAKEAFRTRNFGLSEEQFRRLVERESDNAEAWLGLAASYDQLNRFDLADRAYLQVSKLSGESVALRNNRGFSYLIRGDKKRARQEFMSARSLDPTNAFVRSNLEALGR